MPLKQAPGRNYLGEKGVTPSRLDKEIQNIVNSMGYSGIKAYQVKKLLMEKIKKAALENIKFIAFRPEGNQWYVHSRGSSEDS